MKKSLIFLILAILISSVGILALFRQGFFLTDDGNSMIIRFSAFYEEIRNGQFPVRFLTRLNYSFGYPVADFLYPLFMYIGVPIKALGFSFVDTIKIIFALSFFSGTVFSFFWLKKLFDSKSALIGSVAYSLFPYHLFDIYKRGSVGEVLALGIFPFVLWQIERRSLFWGVIGIFFLILSHNSLAVLFLIFVILYASLDTFVQKNREPLLKYYTKIVILGIGLSSFFSIPALFDLQYTVFSKTLVSDWSKYFIDFNLVGLSTIVIFLMTTVFMMTKRIEIKKHRLTLLLFITGLISIFFASSTSSFLWNLLPVSFIQFPFRFLSLTVVSAAFLAACFISVLKEKEKIIFGTVMLILVLLSSRHFLGPQVFQNYSDSFYSTNQDTTTVKNEYMPKWVKTSFSEMAKSKVENLDGEEKINLREADANKIVFDTFLADNRKVRVNTVYFPGWGAYTNGGKSNIIYDEGFIDLNLGRGKNNVLVKFEETPIRLVADFISAFSLFTLLVLSFRRLKF